MFSLPPEKVKKCLSRMSGKLSRTVLRRGKGSNPFSLVDYRSNDYVNLLNDLGITQSMSRRGNCWDNAKAESFFSHFKCETIKLMKKKLANIHDVKRIVENYMDYYINIRPQRKLGGLSPSSYTLSALGT